MKVRPMYSLGQFVRYLGDNKVWQISDIEVLFNGGIYIKYALVRPIKEIEIDEDKHSSSYYMYDNSIAWIFEEDLEISSEKEYEEEYEEESEEYYSY